MFRTTEVQYFHSLISGVYVAIGLIKTVLDSRLSYCCVHTHMFIIRWYGPGECV